MAKAKARRVVDHPALTPEDVAEILNCCTVCFVRALKGLDARSALERYANELFEISTKLKDPVCKRAIERLSEALMSGELNRL